MILAVSDVRCVATVLLGLRNSCAADLRSLIFCPIMSFMQKQRATKTCRVSADVLLLIQGINSSACLP